MTKTNSGIHCPLCEVWRSDPAKFEHYESPTTPWSDSCSCCDNGPCLKHQLYPNDPMPKKPPPEEMKMRRAKEYVFEQLKYDRQLLRIKEYTNLRAELVNLKNALELTKAAPHQAFLEAQNTKLLRECQDYNDVLTGQAQIIAEQRDRIQKLEAEIEASKMRTPED